MLTRLSPVLNALRIEPSGVSVLLNPFSLEAGAFSLALAARSSADRHVSLKLIPVSIEAGPCSLVLSNTGPQVRRGPGTGAVHRREGPDLFAGGAMKLFLPFFALLLLAVPARAQRGAFDTSRYTFTATYLLPRAEPAIPLAGTSYELSLRADSLVCELPYRGKVYAAPLRPDSLGLFFTSRSFLRRSRQTRKGWVVTLEPKDVRDVYRLVLEVARDGSATLQVFSNRRDVVMFEGTVQ
jgi:hypothetical protein